MNSRPRSENRVRRKIIAVRLSSGEHQLLQAEMARTGKSAAAILRDTFLGARELPWYMKALAEASDAELAEAIGELGEEKRARLLRLLAGSGR